MRLIIAMVGKLVLSAISNSFQQPSPKPARAPSSKPPRALRAAACAPSRRAPSETHLQRAASGAEQAAIGADHQNTPMR